MEESFNASIQIAKTKQVVKMLEKIRRRVRVSNDKKRSEADKSRGDYTPRSRALLDQHIELTKDCSLLSGSLGDYELGYLNDMLVLL